MDAAPLIPGGAVIAVGGGKGGVGKSLFSSNISCGLAKCGKKVVLVDADLAGANIHIFFGVKHGSRTFEDFLKRKVPSLSDVLVPTALPNLHLICGASELLEIANPNYLQKQKILHDIVRLNADIIVIDIGAGASLNNLDFFNAAQTGIIVTTPSPTSLQNAYGFLKMAVHRKILGMFSTEDRLKRELTTAFGDLDRFKSMQSAIDLLAAIDADSAGRISRALAASRYRLVVNMATDKEGERVSKALAGVVYQFLNVPLAPLGFIPYDTQVENSIRRMEPLLLSDLSFTTTSIMTMAERLAADRGTRAAEAQPATAVAPPPAIHSSSRVQISLHDEITADGKRMHVQTEDLGMEKAQIVTLVFSAGQILHSRKSDYRDAHKDPNLQHVVAERVKAQHEAVLKSVRDGVSAYAEGKGA